METYIAPSLFLCSCDVWAFVAVTQQVDGEATSPKAGLIIKIHTLHTEANTRHGRIGILHRGLDPSLSSQMGYVSLQNQMHHLRVPWTPSQMKGITDHIQCHSD